MFKFKRIQIALFTNKSFVKLTYEYLDPIRRGAHELQLENWLNDCDVMSVEVECILQNLIISFIISKTKYSTELHINKIPFYCENMHKTLSFVC